MKQTKKELSIALVRSVTVVTERDLGPTLFRGVGNR